jgi:hypothetical protein
VSLKSRALSERHGATSQKNVLSIMGRGRVCPRVEGEIFSGGRKPRFFLVTQPNFLRGGAGKYAYKLTLKPINPKL